MIPLKNSLTNVTIKKHHLNLKNTLQNGQAFNWWEYGNDKYIGVVGSMLLIMEYDSLQNVVYKCINQNSEYARVTQKEKNINQQINNALNTYFRLDIDLDNLIKEWRERDKYFNEVCSSIQGLRLLRQEPLECLFSFIVSQNNNIKRITSNLLKIRETYGTKLGVHGDKSYYSFPTLEQLINITEKEYRDIGLGYRAIYLVETAQNLKAKGGHKYLLDLIGKKEGEILEELLSYKGVGRKVADCVRLFSLECTQVVPVDTHVFQIYQKKYKHSDSLKIKNYDQITNHFQDKFGANAGWAHSFLFTAELPQFKEVVQTKNETITQEENTQLKKKIKK